MPHNNPCPKCGQMRIIDKTWVEEVTTTGGVSKLTHTLMICPDPVCQQKVERELATMAEKRVALQQAKDQREQDRLHQLANKPRLSVKPEPGI